MERTPLISPKDSIHMKAARISLSPGEDIGEHKTERREELILTLKGEVTLVLGKERIALKEGQAYFLGEGLSHNVVNGSMEEAEYIYVVGLY
jgi:mannose-6-phosphate isomerase-like protein (cupin superfamily)